MTNLQLSRRAFIGFEPLIDAFDNLMVSDNYPPYNVVKESDKVYIVEVAIAGFSIDNIEIEERNNVLTITGERDKRREPAKYIHKGISAKKFTKVFKLADDAKVIDATMSNGVLTVTIEVIVPKAKKVTKIKIKGL